MSETAEPGETTLLPEQMAALATMTPEQLQIAVRDAQCADAKHPPYGLDRDSNGDVWRAQCICGAAEYMRTNFSPYFAPPANEEEGTDDDDAQPE